MVAAFPVLTATFAMLLLDRYLGFHFFSVDAQGNPMMYVNLFWVWGHPEVYILILPAFGIFSEVFSTFSGKPLFGYRSMVAATMVICVLSFLDERFRSSNHIRPACRACGSRCERRALD
jgi:cytochrome o ubiquinol oxidase subunit 1